MSYYYELVAIKYDHNDGSYSIDSKSEIEVLEIDRKILNDVSSDSLYSDHAIVVSKKHFSEHISSDDNKTRDWYENLPDSVALIMVVSREWETGLS